MGVTNSFKVYPGDKIKAEAYVRYEASTSGPGDPSGFASMLATAFGMSSSSVGGELKVYNAMNSYGDAISAGTANTTNPDDPDAPKAFVTITFFDKNYNYLDAAWQQVGEDFDQNPSMIDKDPFDHVSKEVVAKEEGYASVFISNENPVALNVYFDDVNLRIHHPTLYSIMSTTRSVSKQVQAGLEITLKTIIICIIRPMS